MTFALVTGSLSPLFSTKGPSIDVLKNPDITKEFVTAAARGDIDKVRVFLKKRISVDVEDDGATALFCAARNGHSAVVSELIQAGANIERAHSYRRAIPDYFLCATPLAHAIWSDDVATVKVLLDAKARVDICLDGDKFGILHCVVADCTLENRCVREKMLDLLVAAGAPLNIVDRVGNTPFMMVHLRGFTPFKYFCQYTQTYKFLLSVCVDTPNGGKTLQ